MITVNDVSLNFSGQTLFKHVDLKFTPGNCYGIIGANGAGKSTFLRILSGDLEPTTGEVVHPPRISGCRVLKQDHFQYDAYTVLDTVIMGNQRALRHHEGEGRPLRQGGLHRRGRREGQRAGGGVCRHGRLGGREPTCPA